MRACMDGSDCYYIHIQQTTKRSVLGYAFFCFVFFLSPVSLLAVNKRSPWPYLLPILSVEEIKPSMRLASFCASLETHSSS